ncbi:MAG: signal transduction protein [Candidatus Lambdaproteobacteria bacterium RIFOXYD2_FULL_50_16]|uniref:Signal transduction protein n=1 Tax=Candidatus Lambdaproteobacteria bacterium RIFOXYD2_FULL_50_16 TaxID=1817772 RepID=A0A1F6GGK7_9PROT|nr:MAG: signal transduction protein [Candidatus Lambdaproteobacteria bacterium RIFOXYD2_FULL_50_16]
MELLKKIRNTPVSALMTKNVITVTGNKLVSDAIALMKEHKITSVVVLPRNEDDTFGIVTERDVLGKVIDPGEDVSIDPWNTPVFQIMTKPVISVNPEMRVKYALRLMQKFKIRRLLVVDGDRLAGMISETDVLKAVHELPTTQGVAL